MSAGDKVYKASAIKRPSFYVNINLFIAAQPTRTSRLKVRHLPLYIFQNVAQ